MIGERPHDVIEPLAYEHHVRARRDDAPERLDAARLQARLKKVFEKFLAEQIEPVPARVPQHGMQHACGEHPVRGV